MRDDVVAFFGGIALASLIWLVFGIGFPSIPREEKQKEVCTVALSYAPTQRDTLALLKADDSCISVIEVK